MKLSFCFAFWPSPLLPASCFPRFFRVNTAESLSYHEETHKKQSQSSLIRIIDFCVLRITNFAFFTVTEFDATEKTASNYINPWLPTPLHIHPKMETKPDGQVFQCISLKPPT